LGLEDQLLLESLEVLYYLSHQENPVDLVVLLVPEIPVVPYYL
jgi:hypothetical protein